MLFDIINIKLLILGINWYEFYSLYIMTWCWSLCEVLILAEPLAKPVLATEHQPQRVPWGLGIACDVVWTCTWIEEGHVASTGFGWDGEAGAGYGWIHGWGIQDGVAEWLNWNRDLMYLDVTCVFICSLKHTSCKHTSCAAAFIFASPSQKQSLRLEGPQTISKFPNGLPQPMLKQRVWLALEDFGRFCSRKSI